MLLPTYQPPRTKYRSIRGTVVESTIVSKGWWIFKKIYQRIKVELNESQRKAHAERYGNQKLKRDCPIELPEIMPIFLPKKYKEFVSVGSEVGITFVPVTTLEDRLEGNQCFEVVDVVVITEQVQLIHEIKPMLSYEEAREACMVHLRNYEFSPEDIISWEGEKMYTSQEMLEEISNKTLVGEEYIESFRRVWLSVL